MANKPQNNTEKCSFQWLVLQCLLTFCVLCQYSVPSTKPLYLHLLSVRYFKPLTFSGSSTIGITDSISSIETVMSSVALLLTKISILLSLLLHYCPGWGYNLICSLLVVVTRQLSDLPCHSPFIWQTRFQLHFLHPKKLSFLNIYYVPSQWNFKARFLEHHISSHKQSKIV